MPVEVEDSAAWRAWLRSVPFDRGVAPWLTASPTRRTLAKAAASAGLGFGVAAVLAAATPSPIWALLAGGVGAACGWVLANRRRCTLGASQWPPIDDESSSVLPPRLGSEDSLWARLAESAGTPTVLH